MAQGFGIRVILNKNKNCHLYRLPLLLITKCYRTVSTDVLCVLAGIFLIHMSIEKELEYNNILTDQQVNNNLFNLNFKRHLYMIPSFKSEFGIKKDKDIREKLRYILTSPRKGIKLDVHL